MLQTIGISAVTSFLCSIAALLLYFRIFAPPESANALPKDPQFAKYEEIINDFLDTIRKGLNIEFVDEEGSSKISYINVYKTPVIHKKEAQLK